MLDINKTKDIKILNWMKMLKKVYLKKSLITVKRKIWNVKFISSDCNQNLFERCAHMILVIIIFNYTQI